MKFTERFPTGQRNCIGEYHFTATAIKEFAAKFDPQYFHLDEERAKESVLGGLCASGWHICSAWMRTYVKFLFAHISAISADGEVPPKLGPALGFRDLKWLRPAYADDTLTFFCTLRETETSASHPDRMIHTLHCEGEKQDGQKVISFAVRFIEFN